MLGTLTGIYSTIFTAAGELFRILLKRRVVVCETREGDSYHHVPHAME